MNTFNCKSIFDFSILNKSNSSAFNNQKPSFGSFNNPYKDKVFGGGNTGGGGGLFMNNQNKPGGNSLFQTSNTNSMMGTNAMGIKSNSLNSGGIFNQGNTSSGGIFGNTSMSSKSSLILINFLANNMFGNKMGNNQMNKGGGGLFSQTNMQQKSTFGGTQNGIFTPKTLPSNTNAFGGSNTSGIFGTTQTNTLNQGGLFNKGTTNNNMTNSIMSFNNTSGNTMTNNKMGMGMGLGMNKTMGMNTGNTMGMNSANGVQGASTNQEMKNQNAMGFINTMMKLGGTSRKKFHQMTNKKNNFVQTINYLPEFRNYPLVLLRFQDYLTYNNNPNIIPQECKSSLQNYMAKAAGNSMGMQTNNQMGMMGGNTGGLFNNNNTTNNFNQNKGIVNNLNMTGSRNISIPGMGNNTTGQTNSMFNNGMNRTTSGLFNTNNTMGNKSMMGTNSMTQSTLFNKPAMGGTQSMFNTNTSMNTMNKPNGLFNNNMSTANTSTTGLFNNTMNKPANSMFNNTANTGGLFKSNTTSTTGTGLFNNMAKPTGMFNSNPTGTTNTGLFNNNTMGNKSQLFNKPTGATNSLFNTTPNTGTQGLFNAPGKMTTNMNMNMNMNQRPMGNQPMMNPNMMPMNLPNGGYAMVVLPLNNDKNNSQSNNPANPNNQANPNYNNLLQNIALLTGNKSGLPSTENDSLNSILYEFKKFDTDHYNHHSVHTPEKYSNDMLYDSILSVSNYESPFIIRSKTQNFLKAKANAKKILKGMKKNSKKRQKIQRNFKKSVSKSFLNKSNMTNKSKDILSKSVLSSENEAKKPKIVQVETKKKESKPILKKGRDIEVTIILEKFGPNSKWKVTINEEDYVAALFEKAVEMKLIREESIQYLTILHKNQELATNQLFKSYNIGMRETLHIYNSNNVDKYFAEITMVPRCTKDNLIFSPDFVDLCRMTEEELKNVNQFSIENEHGRIEFLDTVDLRNVDFDKDIIIDHKCIEVYGDRSPEQKPKKGEGLNQTARITFFNFRKKQSMTSKKFLGRLKKYAKKMKAEFLGYDEEAQEVSIMVNNF
jgi:hypothetical protein